MNLFSRCRPSNQVNPWLVTFIISLSTFMEVLDSSIANVSLGHIAGGLAAGLDESTWVLTSYLVANAVMMPVSGCLGNTLGRKLFFMICIIIFTISSFFCALAPSLNWLLFFRVLQGLGGAGMAPTVQSLLADLFPSEKRGLAFSIYGLSVVFAPAIGPTLGGWITDNYSWKWIFLINIPVGIISLVLTMFFVRDPNQSELGSVELRGRRFDLMGFVLSLIGIGCLEFFVDRGQREDWFASPLIVTLAIIAGVSLLTLVFWESWQETPVVNIHLLRRARFLAAFVMMFMTGFVLFGTTAIFPQFLEQLLGYTAEQAGFALTAGGFALVILMPLVGAVLIQKFSTRVLVGSGLLILALSLFHLSGFNLNMTFQQAALARVFQVGGIALIFVPITRVAYDGLHPTESNDAAALINLARNLGGSVGIALSNTVLSQRSQFHQARLIEHISSYENGTQLFLHRLQSRLPSFHYIESMHQAYQEVTRQASMLSYLDVFIFLGIASLAIFPLIFLMPRGVSQTNS
ncbi:MAG: EmrB/QacA family drug resistance transporter [Verrucomicrobia bacterium]|nr:MAG: EmrB/QacA family drug resistance transporter [Verrucomicrobiota bacterium]